MQRSISDYVESSSLDAGPRLAGFRQENADGSRSIYACRWASRSAKRGAGRAAGRYLQSCFNDPSSVGRHFTAEKLRCHHLASAVPVTRFIVRRFARESPKLCHINLRTGKRLIPEAFATNIADLLSESSATGNHERMQLQAFSLNMFAALEVPLHSPRLTGHLDCLLCDDEEDILYAVEVKSYPSDPMDPWAGTSRFALERNLVQSVAYAELLSRATGSDRVAAGLLHSQGVLIFDAREWLRGERTLLHGVERYLGSEGSCTELLRAPHEI